MAVDGKLETSIENLAHSVGTSAPADNEGRLQAILESCFDAFVEVDEAGVITGWNSRAEGIFGWSYSEVVRQSFHVLVPARLQADYERAMQEFRETGQSSKFNQRIESNALHRDGHEFPVQLVASAVPWGESRHFISFVRDITK